MASSAGKRRRAEPHQEKVRAGIQLLQDRGVFAHRVTKHNRHSPPGTQKAAIAREILFLTHPTKAPAGQQAEWLDIQQRMLWMMEGDQFCDSLTFNDEDVQRFEDLPTHGEYERSKLPPVFGQSVQRHGTCFMNAPAVVQHDVVNRYLVQNGQEPTQQSLNMLQWLRNHSDAASLDAYVFDGLGGNSCYVLDNILLPGSVTTTIGAESIAEHLERYGPGLLIFQMVHEDFMDETKHQHFGASTAPLYGDACKTGGDGHAVVLIGVRREAAPPTGRGTGSGFGSTRGRGAAGREIFLLQNWWPKKQFVEVDAEYLDSCKAGVMFVKTPQTRTRTEFAQDVSTGVLRVSHDVPCRSNRQRYGPC